MGVGNDMRTELPTTVLPTMHLPWHVLPVSMGCMMRIDLIIIKFLLSEMNPAPFFSFPGCFYKTRGCVGKKWESVLVRNEREYALVWIEAL